MLAHHVRVSGTNQTMDDEIKLCCCYLIKDATGMSEQLSILAEASHLNQ